MPKKNNATSPEILGNEAEEIMVEEKKKVIYISHPYSGSHLNANRVANIVIDLVRENRNETYISPIHALGFMYHAFPYATGLEMCLDLLAICDEIRVYGNYESSKGCLAEIEFAKQHDIPIKFMTK